MRDRDQEEGIVVHRESKTFDKQKLAKDWGMRREIELQEASIYKKRDHLPLKKVIKQYMRDFQPTGRTKYADLTALTKWDIALKNVHTLTSKDLSSHIRQRNKECQPQPPITI